MIDRREITPELLARLTALLFSKLRVRSILKDQCNYSRLTVEQIADVMIENTYFRRALSETACRSFAQSVVDYVNQKTRWKYGGKRTNNGSLHVYELLLLTLQDLLTANRNRAEIRYEELHSWRIMVQELGEELLLAAFYANWDHEHSKENRSNEDEFSWSYTTPHNNKQLNMILSRGVSDHHCHLAASTPYFHVSWINLMNNITDSTYREKLEMLSKPKWSGGEKDESSIIRENWGMLARLRSAWIRFYLCTKLRAIQDGCDVKEQDREFPEHCCLTDCSAKELCLRKVRKVQTRYSREFECVRKYDNWRQLLLSGDRLQAEIDAYAFVGGCKEDYALGLSGLKHTEKSPDYRILLGERWMYYSIFRDFLSCPEDRKLSHDDYKMFFLYFRLRLWARDRMVQNNDLIGFDNFQKIERRKLSFLGDPSSERALTRLTVNEILKKPYIRELEVRISPLPEQIKTLEKAVEENEADTASQFIRSISGEENTASELKDRYYYVFHFLKRRDVSFEEHSSYRRVCEIGRIHRHQSERQYYMEQAEQILRFREEDPLHARRVLGIDAASNEDGCRPEVFGTVFRLLSNHQFVYGGYDQERKVLPALGKTYHVGEDFHDVVDGLRAIDEAINFLELDCGDRLGHAMALGVNVEDWYEQRNRGISLPVQDYLDNLAWMNHALIHYSIPNTAALRERLKRDFDHWFRIVYRNNMDDAVTTEIMQSAEQYYRSRHRIEDSDGRYHAHTCNFDIMSYYRAWTLRGDDPSCYIDGYFKKPNCFAGREIEERSKVCESYPRHYNERYVPEYSLLNYFYQFNAAVREKGLQRIKVDISQEYILAVKDIQMYMRYRIARKGIAIETNPTSNVMIGTFRKYEEHPILTFFNRGLPVTDEEEQGCSQLQVSINTDDCGVFYTDLEMEYALLARSVEEIKNVQDAPRFKKYDIYTWLDNIRVMGNDQSFRHRNEDA